MLLALSAMAYSQTYKMNLHFKSGTVVDFYVNDLDSTLRVPWRNT